MPRGVRYKPTEKTVVVDPNEFQAWIGRIYIYKRRNRTKAQIIVPIGIVKTLRLKHKDRVQVAIRREPNEENSSKNKLRKVSQSPSI